MVFLQLAFLSMGEALLIIAIILLFFGATRIPVIARNLGKSVREFKDASKKQDKKEKE
jgi:sec-independent protein translocase protein TatA